MLNARIFKNGKFHQPVSDHVSKVDFVVMSALAQAAVCHSRSTDP